MGLSLTTGVHLAHGPPVASGLGPDTGPKNADEPNSDTPTSSLALLGQIGGLDKSGPFHAYQPLV